MEPAELTEEKEKGRGETWSWGRQQGTTDLDFTGIKLFLDITKEEIKRLINGALETRLNSSKIQ